MALYLLIFWFITAMFNNNSTLLQKNIYLSDKLT